MNIQANREQAVLWNGSAGRAWVEQQALLDQMFEPFAARLIDAAAATKARHVLDVGCGAGATTLAITRHLGSGGRALGVDISQPLIAVARERATRDASPARFECADAQTHEFGPGAFDLVVSRFGVMFFDDPVAAFANLRNATCDDGALHVIAFRSVAENPFMTTAEHAAAPFLSNVPPRQPDAPGQFAFANAERVGGILQQSGWSQIGLTPIDVTCAFPESELDGYFTRLGPVGLALQGADEATRAQVLGRIRAAFAPYVYGAEVRFVAACWMVSGTAARAASSAGAADRESVDA